MISISDRLRSWLATHRAERADRAECQSAPKSAHCARSARTHRDSGHSLPKAGRELGEDGQYVLLERLSMADELAFATDPESPAYRLALLEAQSEDRAAGAVAGAPGGVDRVIKVVSELLGRLDRADVAEPDERLHGEPDWKVIPRLPVMHPLTGECFACRWRRWWRQTSQSAWTCGACHPPAPGLEVTWLEPGAPTRPRATPPPRTSRSAP